MDTPGASTNRVSTARGDAAYGAKISKEDGLASHAWRSLCPAGQEEKSAPRKHTNVQMEEDETLQSDTITTLRTLAHDLSNSIETIMQAAYLLAQVKLDGDNRRWLEMIERAAQDAARINREIREILRTQSPQG